MRPKIPFTSICRGRTPVRGGTKFIWSNLDRQRPNKKINSFLRNLTYSSLSSLTSLPSQPPAPATTTLACRLVCHKELIPTKITTFRKSEPRCDYSCMPPSVTGKLLPFSTTLDKDQHFHTPLRGYCTVVSVAPNSILRRGRQLQIHPLAPSSPPPTLPLPYSTPYRDRVIISFRPRGSYLSTPSFKIKGVRNFLLSSNIKMHRKEIHQQNNKTTNMYSTH